jgi:SSS family solute:Na+ symporter
MKYISPQLYIYLQSVQAYIAPPIAACFLFGVLSTRLNGKGAMSALITGLVLGTLRLVLELGKSNLAPGSVAHWFASINFLIFAALLFVLCTLILAVVSYATAPPTPEHIAELTYKTDSPVTMTAAERGRRRVDVLMSLLLAAIIGVLWVVFR